MFSEITKKYLKNNLSKTNNRYRVNLFNDEGAKLHYIHQLVALVYIDNPNNYPIINHIDGDPHNNDVSNLEWTTHEGNSIHAVQTGLSKVRSLNVEEAHHVFSLLQDGFRNCDIADITGFPYAVISKMRQGANYRDIWEEYEIPIKSHTISLNKAEKIIDWLLAGKNTSEIIKKFKVGRNIVKDLRDGKKFSSLLAQKKKAIRNE